tara:strand:+ start:98 stop:313 length:216 start_codon:yes stop_codon:yes gene_type:complete
LSQEANRERLSKKHNYNNTLPFHANSSFLFKQNEINGVTGLLPDFFCGEKMSLKKVICKRIFSTQRRLVAD